MARASGRPTSVPFFFLGSSILFGFFTVRRLFTPLGGLIVFMMLYGSSQCCIYVENLIFMDLLLKK